ncbi:MAG: excinuclease [Ruminococcaceae bacterium]|nr:excinuclease [Oscillospiraceae bacterium]
MLCEKCKKNNATVKIVKNYNGIITEKHLCQVCAGNDEFNFSEFSKGSILNDLFGMFTPVTTSDYVCDRCNTSYKEFKETGKFGCADCYEKFEVYLDPLFKNIHASSSHTGKIPKRCGEDLKNKKLKSELKLKLQKAIAEENYEEAAKIRDEIKGLEG